MPEPNPSVSNTGSKSSNTLHEMGPLHPLTTISMQETLLLWHNRGCEWGNSVTWCREDSFQRVVSWRTFRQNISINFGADLLYFKTQPRENLRKNRPVNTLGLWRSIFPSHVFDPNPPTPQTTAKIHLSWFWRGCTLHYSSVAIQLVCTRRFLKGRMTNCLIISCMEQSPYWGVDDLAAGRDISKFSWNLVVHCNIHKSQILDLIVLLI
jgi:hypothetical protein